jgi:hypothetical protein
VKSRASSVRADTAYQYSWRIVTLLTSKEGSPKGFQASEEDCSMRKEMVSFLQPEGEKLLRVCRRVRLECDAANGISEIKTSWHKKRQKFSPQRAELSLTEALQDRALGCRRHPPLNFSPAGARCYLVPPPLCDEKTSFSANRKGPQNALAQDSNLFLVPRLSLSSREGTSTGMQILALFRAGASRCLAASGSHLCRVCRSWAKLSRGDYPLRHRME